jgi:C4-dicarboxylate transporter
VRVLALILLLVATVITTGSTLAALLALRRATPQVSWKLRLLPVAVMLGAGAVFE